MLSIINTFGIKKILIIVLLLVALVSCGANKDNLNKENNNDKKIEKTEWKFKDLTKYIKSDITDNESNELIKILENRVEKQAEIKELILSATKENSKEILDKVLKIRQEYTKEILPFVSEEQKASFNKYFQRINYSIEKKLNNIK